MFSKHLQERMSGVVDEPQHTLNASEISIANIRCQGAIHGWLCPILISKNADAPLPALAHYYIVVSEHMPVSHYYICKSEKAVLAAA